MKQKINTMYMMNIKQCDEQTQRSCSNKSY